MLDDSLTFGSGSCLTLAGCTRNSWSPGGGTQVNSHYLRIRARNPAISWHNRNFAVPGARPAGRAGRAAAAIREKVDYVTVLIGASERPPACGMWRSGSSRPPSGGTRGLATIKKGFW